MGEGMGKMGALNSCRCKFARTDTTGGVFSIQYSVSRMTDSGVSERGCGGGGILATKAQRHGGFTKGGESGFPPRFFLLNVREAMTHGGEGLRSKAKGLSGGRNRFRDRTMGAHHRQHVQERLGEAATRLTPEARGKAASSPERRNSGSTSQGGGKALATAGQARRIFETAVERRGGRGSSEATKR